MGKDKVLLQLLYLIFLERKFHKRINGEKIALKKGETKQVVFNVNHSDLMFYNKDLKLVAEPGEFEVMMGPNSRDVKAVSFWLK